MADLEVKSKSDKNFWSAREYVVWFANRYQWVGKRPQPRLNRLPLPQVWQQGVCFLRTVDSSFSTRMNDHGFTVAVFNRTVARVDEFPGREAKGNKVIGHPCLETDGVLGEADYMLRASCHMPWHYLLGDIYLSNRTTKLNRNSAPRPLRA